MNWQYLGGPDPEPPDDDEIDEAEKRMRAEDAAEDAYIESQRGRDDLADAAEDLWLKSRGY